MYLAIGAVAGFGACEKTTCVRKWGVIAITLNGVSRSQVDVGATGEIVLGSQTLRIVCPNTGNGKDIGGTCNLSPDPPRIDLAGYGVDVVGLSSVILTLYAVDGTLLADHVSIALTPPRLVEPDGSAEFCERDGALM
jgi:hypothetical protein